jgi:hypothetical protein
MATGLNKKTTAFGSGLNTQSVKFYFLKFYSLFFIDFELMEISFNQII